MSISRLPPTAMTSTVHGSHMPADVLEELQLLAAQNLENLDLGHFYEEVRELGRGTYGKVDLVVHKLRGTKMAMKFLKKTSTKQRSFLREYSTSLYLSPCRFIIDTYAVAFQTHDCYVFAQEFAPAGDLFDIIPPQVGLAEGVAKRCVRQVALALDYLHSRRLVHRDIKPENVLVFDPECRTVKLADFGMTRRAGSPVRRVSGTIPYTAPELGAAARQEASGVEEAADVWAFGVLLFCVLTGNFPWEKATPTDAFYEEFVRWQRRRACAVPSQWRRFTDAALRMFRGLLTVEPERRCGVTEVFGYLSPSWMLDTQDANDGGHDSGEPPLDVSASSSAEDTLVDRLKQQSLSPACVTARGVVTRDYRYSSTSADGSQSSAGGPASIVVTTPIEICA